MDMYIDARVLSYGGGDNEVPNTLGSLRLEYLQMATNFLKDESGLYCTSLSGRM